MLPSYVWMSRYPIKLTERYTIYLSIYLFSFPLFSFLSCLLIYIFYLNFLLINIERPLYFFQPPYSHNCMHFFTEWLCVTVFYHSLIEWRIKITLENLLCENRLFHYSMSTLALDQESIFTIFQMMCVFVQSYTIIFFFFFLFFGLASGYKFIPR